MRDIARAGSGAAPEMVVEAGPLRLSERFLAGAHAVDARGDIDDVLTTDAAHEGAEVLSVLLDAAGDGNMREGLLRVELDVGIRLVILQKDVIFGLVLLDEGVFEGERVHLAGGDDIGKVGDVLDHRLHFGGLGRGMEVLPHAVFEYPRLADIDDDAVFIHHQIDARRIGQQLEFFLYDTHPSLLYTSRQNFSRAYGIFLRFFAKTAAFVPLLAPFCPQMPLSSLKIPRPLKGRR